MSRVDRLRASLEEPLLVTNAVNVRYLVGFSSSNAALFVEPDLGPDPFWVCHRTGLPVSSVGALPRLDPAG